MMTQFIQKSFPTYIKKLQCLMGPQKKKSLLLAHSTNEVQCLASYVIMERLKLTL